MPPSHDVPHDLARFVEAQSRDYAQALVEVRAGRKRSHWMWYVFPQFDGLGFSATSRHFAIKSLAEARDYLQHPTLGRRLIECCDALLILEGRSAHDIFGYPDEMKLRSSMTLFAHVSPDGSIFHRVLSKYFDSQPDEQTIKLITNAK
jgi:uncharacterized protein (DUF1810 family)